jgi:Domain of unknown function (DUF4114)
MRTKNCLALIIILFMLNSCKKEAVSREVKFTSTEYQFLGAYDSSGLPKYLATPDTISAAMLAFISATLPDGKNLTLTHPELFTSTATADIYVGKLSDIYVTFVSAGAAFTNSIAFYTYPATQPPQSASDIKEITYIFPNAGNHTPLHSGDKVKIGTFDVGTTVGFLLLENSWNVATSKLNNDVVHFCTDDVLNPEVDPNLKRHAVLINYTPENKVLISFDDSNRTTPECDNDFNDVVIYCTVTPPL